VLARPVGFEIVGGRTGGLRHPAQGLFDSPVMRQLL
jgi:hypothetical protein